MRSNDAIPFDFIYYLVIILRKFMGSEMSHIQTDMKIGNFISKILFYHFSFNITGGRCEECKGSGKELIQMKFLPDFYIECKSCLGKRFQEKILKIKLKEKVNEINNFNNLLDIYNKYPSNHFEKVNLQQINNRINSFTFLPAAPSSPSVPFLDFVNVCAFVSVTSFSIFMLYSISELSVPFATPLWSATVIFFSLPVFSVKLPTVILSAVVVISY